MNFHKTHCNHSSTSNANHSFVALCNDSYMLKDLNKRIAAIRSEAGDTPNSAAKKVGISRTGYIKWEEGQTENMKLGNLLSFCSAYKINLVDLLLGEQLSPQQSTVLTVEEPTHRYADDNLQAVTDFYSRLPLARKYKINIAIAKELMEEKAADPDFDVGDLGRLFEMKR